MNISKAQLIAIMPTCAAHADTWVDVLNTSMGAYGITTPARITMFLANAAEESTELSRLRENLNYSSGMRLKNVFPSHFASIDEADTFAHDPVRIANRVYCDRLGNGDEASGDGWKFIGRGILQLTGKEEYTAYAKYRQIQCVAHPELLELPQHAADSACWFWAEFKSANAAADLGDFQRTVRIVNGGINGWIQRKTYFDRAVGVLT